MPTIKRFSGINNVMRPEVARPGDLQTATGVYVTNTGGIKRRAGRRPIHTFDAHSIFSDKSDLFFVTNGILRRYDGVNFFTVETVGPAATGISFARVAGNIYYSNGTLSGVVLPNGTRNSWGVAVPPAPAVANSVGDLLDGSYSVALAYVLSDGQETGTSIPQAVNVTTGGIALTGVVASADPRVTGIAVYVTTPDGRILPDGRGMYLSNTLPNVNGSGTVTTPPGSDRPCTTFNLSPMPKGRYVGFYRGRLYVAVGKFIFYSEQWRYELCNLETNFLPFADNVVAILPVENGIWVGTEREYMFLAGSDPRTDGGFSIRSRSLERMLDGGTVLDSDLMNQRSLAKGRLAIWLTAKGIHVGDANGQYVNITGEYWVPGTEIGGPRGAIVDAAGEQLYVFVLGSDAYAMNLMNGSVTRLNGNTNSVAEHGGKLYAGAADGLRVYDDEVDVAGPISATISKTGIDYGDPRIKKYTDLYFHMRSNGNLQVTVASETGSGTVTLVDGIDTMHGSKADLPRGVMGRSLALTVSNVGGSFFEIVEIDAVTEVSTTRRGRQTGG